MRSDFSLGCSVQSQSACTTSSHVRRGGAALEFAILLPLIMLLSLGCVDFGRVAYFSIALNSATGSGLATGTTHRFTDYTRTSWENQIRLAVQEDLQSVSGFNLADLSQSIVVTQPNGLPISVAVNVTYPFRTIVKWPGIPKTFLLRQTLTGNQYR